MNGVFLTFEGLDGSGKSTHLERAVAWLGERSLPALRTREPGGTPLGDAIRQIFLLDRRFTNMDSRVEALLVFASRRQHLVEVIEPALARGATCSATASPTPPWPSRAAAAASAATGSAGLDAARHRHPPARPHLPVRPARRGRHGARPAPPPQGRRRARPHRRRRPRASTTRCASAYLALAAAEPARFRVIDSSGNADATWQAVEGHLRELFGAAGMNFDDVLRLAREERLYPAVILYGANEAARQEAALRLARVLLCEKEGAERGCEPDRPPLPPLPAHRMAGRRRLLPSRFRGAPARPAHLDLDRGHQDLPAAGLQRALRSPRPGLRHRRSRDPGRRRGRLPAQAARGAAQPHPAAFPAAGRQPARPADHPALPVARGFPRRRRRPRPPGHRRPDQAPWRRRSTPSSRPARRSTCFSAADHLLAGKAASRTRGPAARGPWRPPPWSPTPARGPCRWPSAGPSWRSPPSCSTRPAGGSAASPPAACSKVSSPATCRRPPRRHALRSPQHLGRMRFPR